MTLPVFPIGPAGGPQPIRGFTWPVTKRQVYSTLVNWSPGGARYTVPLFPNNPLWEFEFNYDILLNNSTDRPLGLNPYYPAGQTIPWTDFQVMEAFYMNAKGQGFEFVFQPDDSIVTGQLLANVDSNNNTELIHTIGAYPTLPAANSTVFNIINESVQDLNGANPVIKLDGVISGGWTLLGANSTAPYEGLVVHFSSPPVANRITADFTYYYRCAFSEDNQEYDQFMYNLYSLKTVKIQQVRVIP